MKQVMSALIYLVTFYVAYKALDVMIQTTMPPGFDFWKLDLDYNHCVVLATAFGLLYGAPICAHHIIRCVFQTSAAKKI